jgi:hypothetical protein
MDWDVIYKGLTALFGTLVVTFGGQRVLAGFVASGNLRLAALCLGIGFSLGAGMRFEPSDPAQITHLGGSALALWLFWRRSEPDPAPDQLI